MAATIDLVTQPLISISANSIQLLDIILPPLLIGLALIIYDIQSHKSSTTSSISSHVFTNHTEHARLLPSKSTHQFKYNLLQFGLDLDQLESGQLDVPYLFKFINPSHQNHDRPTYFDPSSWLKFIQIFSISVSSYHSAKNFSRYSATSDQDQSSTHSIKFSLFDQLKYQFGIPDPHHQIGKVYLLSMPTYLGFSSINPLSIYFCYQKPTDSNHPNHPPLKYVVLDVQNTFSERHSYLLTVGLNESSECPSGFQHEWTIPRAFHVSPFNDRSGFYKVSISDPFSNTKLNTSSELTKVKVNVKIVLLTSTGQKKFLATLHGIGVPFTKTALIRTWMNFPIILFLTTIRILYQSFILHLGKPRLNVFPKPVPYFDLDHGLKGPNPVQADAPIGGTGWQEPDWCSNWSKQIVVDYLNERVNQIAQSITHSIQKPPNSNPDQKDELTSIGSFENLSNSADEGKSLNGLSSRSSLSKSEEEEKNEEISNSSSKVINVVLKPANLTQEIIKILPDLSKQQELNLPTEDLIIHYGSPSFFNDLILFPTPLLAQLICDESEASWKVSSKELFDLVFENLCAPQSDRLMSTGMPNQNPEEIKSSFQLSIAHLLLKVMTSVRSIYFNWLMSFMTETERNSDQLNNRSSWLPPPHFLEINADFLKQKIQLKKPNAIEMHLSTSSQVSEFKKLLSLIKILIILIYLNVIEKMHYFIFYKFLNFRFVPFFQPWFVMKRSIFIKNRIMFSQFLDASFVSFYQIGSVPEQP